MNLLQGLNSLRTLPPGAVMSIGNYDGVHLGQDDLPPDAAREVLGERAIIGFSTHNVEQAIAAARLPVDYIAVGPVFATTSKRALQSSRMN